MGSLQNLLCMLCQEGMRWLGGVSVLELTLHPICPWLPREGEGRGGRPGWLSECFLLALPTRRERERHTHTPMYKGQIRGPTVRPRPQEPAEDVVVTGPEKARRARGPRVPESPHGRVRPGGGGLGWCRGPLGRDTDTDPVAGPTSVGSLGADSLLPQLHVERPRPRADRETRRGVRTYTQRESSVCPGRPA